MALPKSFTDMFGDGFDDANHYKVVSKDTPKTVDMTLTLYRGMNVDLNKLQKDISGNFILSPTKSEQGAIWFTHNLINGYNAKEYVSGRGNYLLTYPLQCKKHIQVVHYADGSTHEMIPDEIRNKEEPTENCKFYNGYELPDGFFFSYKMEKFIICTKPLSVSPNMLTPQSTVISKSWYKKLKVASDNIVYHGTDQMFSEFKDDNRGDNQQAGNGYYFTDNKSVANDYSMNKIRREHNKPEGYGNPRVIPAKLNIKNVFDFDKPVSKDTYEKIQSKLLEQDITENKKDLLIKLLPTWSSKNGKSLYINLSSFISCRGTFNDINLGVKDADIPIFDDVNILLQLAGFDGIVFTRTDNDISHRTWVAFNKSQIQML